MQLSLCACTLCLVIPVKCVHLLLQHIDLALPQEMIDGMGQFKQFYEATNKHRKLGWVYALGTCHVKGNFDARPVELILTTFQATLLLLFNTGQLLCLSASIQDTCMFVMSATCVR